MKDYLIFPYKPGKKKNACTKMLAFFFLQERFYHKSKVFYRENWAQIEERFTWVKSFLIPFLYYFYYLVIWYSVGI
jgi:hypothetical protein